jgi:hypothetical protein
MAHVVDDRVLETTTTTGTGALTLAGAVTGFKAFNAATDYLTGTSIASPNDTVPYYIEAIDGSGNPTGDWESGIGTYSASNQLTRTTVLRSSAGGSAVSLAAGTKRVGIPYNSKLIANLDNNLIMRMPATTLASLNATNTPASQIGLFGSLESGKMWLQTIGPFGGDRFVQEAFWHNGGVFYLPNTTTTIGLNYGGPWVAGGTVSHPTPGSSAPAIVNQQKRTRFANIVTTQNQVLGLSMMTAPEMRYWRGNAAGLGGFFFFARYIVELWPAATCRIFVGLSDQTTAVVVSDTLAGNLIGFWHATTDGAAVLSFTTRDGATASSNSITLTGNIAAGNCFDFYIYCPPNGSTIYYRVEDIQAGTVLADSSKSTNLPANTVFMGPQIHMSNGTANTTVTTVAPGIPRIWIDSDL